MNIDTRSNEQNGKRYGTCKDLKVKNLIVFMSALFVWIIIVFLSIFNIIELITVAGASYVSHSNVPYNRNGVIGTDLVINFDSVISNSLIDSFKVRFQNSSEKIINVSLSSTGGECEMNRVGQFLDMQLSHAFHTDCAIGTSSCSYPSITTYHPSLIDHITITSPTCFLGINGHLCASIGYSSISTRWNAFEFTANGCHERGYLHVENVLINLNFVDLVKPISGNGITVTAFSTDHIEIDHLDHLVVGLENSIIFKVAPKSDFCFFNSASSCKGPVVAHGIANSTQQTLSVIKRPKDRAYYDEVILRTQHAKFNIHNNIIGLNPDYPTLNTVYPNSVFNSITGEFDYNITSVHSIVYQIKIPNATLINVNDLICTITSISGTCKQINDLNANCNLNFKTTGVGFFLFTIGNADHVMPCGTSKEFVNTVISSDTTHICWKSSDYRQNCFVPKIEWDYIGIGNETDTITENESGIDHLRKQDFWSVTLIISMIVLSVFNLFLGFLTIQYATKICVCVRMFSTYTEI